MSKHSRPRHGGLAFYPRKKASKIYGSFSIFPEEEANRVQGFAGYKAGMTHALALDTYDKSPTYGQTIAVPATIIECSPLVVFGIRAYSRDAYGLHTISDLFAENFDKDLAKKLSVPKEKPKPKEIDLANLAEVRALVHTKPRKIKLKKTPEIFEIKVSGKDLAKAWEYAKSLLGKELHAKDIFKEGDVVDVASVSTGKGTQGPVKRFGIKIQTRKAHKKRRHVGTLGPWNPARVIWTVAMAGQLGFQRRTEYNKQIIRIGEGKDVTPAGGLVNYGKVDGDFILLKGSVPGPKKRLIVMRPSIRNAKAPLPSIQMLSVASQQG